MNVFLFFNSWSLSLLLLILGLVLPNRAQADLNVELAFLSPADEPTYELPYKDERLADAIVQLQTFLDGRGISCSLSGVIEVPQDQVLFSDEQLPTFNSKNYQVASYLKEHIECEENHYIKGLLYETGYLEGRGFGIHDRWNVELIFYIYKEGSNGEEWFQDTVAGLVRGID